MRSREPGLTPTRSVDWGHPLQATLRIMVQPQSVGTELCHKAQLITASHSRCHYSLAVAIVHVRCGSGIR